MIDTHYDQEFNIYLGNYLSIGFWVGSDMVKLDGQDITQSPLTVAFLTLHDSHSIAIDIFKRLDFTDITDNGYPYDPLEDVN
jgi:hypothetical protein